MAKRNNWSFTCNVSHGEELVKTKVELILKSSDSSGQHTEFYGVTTAHAFFTRSEQQALLGVVNASTAASIQEELDASLRDRTIVMSLEHGGIPSVDNAGPPHLIFRPWYHQRERDSPLLDIAVFKLNSEQLQATGYFTWEIGTKQQSNVSLFGQANTNFDKVVKIESFEDFYSLKGKSIRCAQKVGHIVSTSRPKQHSSIMGQHIEFALDKDEHIRPGDSGSLVYLLGDDANQDSHIVGMFLGAASCNDGMNLVYCAMILSKALSEINRSEPFQQMNLSILEPPMLSKLNGEKRRSIQPVGDELLEDESEGSNSQLFSLDSGYSSMRESATDDGSSALDRFTSASSEVEEVETGAGQFLATGNSVSDWFMSECREGEEVEIGAGRFLATAPKKHAKVEEWIDAQQMKQEPADPPGDGSSESDDSEGSKSSASSWMLSNVGTPWVVFETASSTGSARASAPEIAGVDSSDTMEKLTKIFTHQLQMSADLQKVIDGLSKHKEEAEDIESELKSASNRTEVTDADVTDLEASMAASTTELSPTCQEHQDSDTQLETKSKESEASETADVDSSDIVRQLIRINAHQAQTTAAHSSSASESQTVAKKCGKTTAVSQMEQEKIFLSREEGAVSSSSAMTVSPDPNLKESPQPSVSGVAKLSSAVQPRQISIDKIKERLIPLKLKESISRICDKKNVRSFSLMQNPKNPKQIAIMGAEEGQLVPADLEKLQTGEFSDYQLTAPPGRKRVYTKQLMWRNALKLERFDHQVTKTCELVVRAWSPIEETEWFFMVGAAHLMFTEEENLRLMDSADLNTLQREVNAIPQRKVIHFRHGASSERNPETQDEEADQTLSITNHPPLISYRYYYQQQEGNRDQFQLLLSASRNGETVVLQPDEEAEEISESQCRNDLILFPISLEKAVHLQRQLQNYRPSRREHLIELTNINQLLFYTTPSASKGETRIAVKNFVGKLCNAFLTGPDQQEFGEGYHLMFTLDEGELVDGDSGSIVFEVKENGEHHLLGMLVGRVDTHGIFSDPEVYYEAIILNLALKDIKLPDDATDLRPFTID